MMMTQSQPRSEMPTPQNPLVLYTPPEGERFDPTPLMDILGTPNRYESAVLITYRTIEQKEMIDTSWGPAEADPSVDVVATPWIQKGDEVVRAGKDYPLKIVELDKRELTELKTPDDQLLLKKPGATPFFRIPSNLHGAILVYSPESSKDGKAQSPKRKGDIIAFTDTGPWVMQWDSSKFKEV